MFLEDINPKGTDVITPRTRRSYIQHMTVETTMLPYIKATTPIPSDNCIQQQTVVCQQNEVKITNAVGTNDSDSRDMPVTPVYVPKITTTPPTPSDSLFEKKPVFYNTSDDIVSSDATQLEDLEQVIRGITTVTPNNCTRQQPDTCESDLVLIEISRSVAPLRSPLFSRVHVSDVDIDTQCGLRINSVSSLKSKTLPSDRDLKKGYFKYLNRQISVSTPDLYHSEIREDLDLQSSCVGMQSRTSSSLFYVNEDDEETEVADNKRLSGLLKTNRYSMRSVRSNTSSRSGWTISSGNRISVYSHVDVGKTDTNDGAIAIDTMSMGFAVDDNDNTDYTQRVAHERQRMPKLLFTVIASLLFPFFSMMIYIWDFGSDIRLALEYWKTGETMPFALTMLCIIVPVSLMSMVDISWVWMDRPKRPYTMTFRISFFLGILSLGRLVRAVKHMTQIVKSKVLASEEKRRWHHDRAMDEKRDYYMLDFINTFTESVPQLVVQLYLYYTYNLTMTKLRFLNIFSSWISIAWVYAAYYRCNREAMTGRKDINIVGFAVFFLAVLSWIAARVMSITHFLLTFNNWICAAVLFVHSFAAFVWIVLRVKPEMEGVVSSRLGRYLYYLFFAYVYNMCFLHLNSSPGKRSMIVFYVAVYIENFVLAGLSMWIYSESELENAHSLIVLPLGSCLHVFFLILFYKFFLPKAIYLDQA